MFPPTNGYYVFGLSVRECTLQWVRASVRVTVSTISYELIDGISSNIAWLLSWYDRWTD